MRSSTLVTEGASRPVRDGTDPARVAQAFQRWALPCGTGPLNRLEELVEERFRDVQSLGDLSPGTSPERWESWLQGVLSSRPYRAAILSETPREDLQEVLRAARRGSYGARDIARLAPRVRGAPPEVQIDVMADLLHAAAPDRIALLARWVFNPERGTGVLEEFVGPKPATYEATQARLGELRLQLAQLGFPSSTFAAVDILLALTYAGRVQQAAQETFHSGGFETLLPGNYGLASMILGVRRRRS